MNRSIVPSLLAWTKQTGNTFSLTYGNSFGRARCTAPVSAPSALQGGGIRRSPRLATNAGEPAKKKMHLQALREMGAGAELYVWRGASFHERNASFFSFSSFFQRRQTDTCPARSAETRLLLWLEMCVAQVLAQNFLLYIALVIITALRVRRRLQYRGAFAGELLRPKRRWSAGRCMARNREKREPPSLVSARRRQDLSQNLREETERCCSCFLATPYGQAAALLLPWVDRARAGAQAGAQVRRVRGRDGSDRALRQPRQRRGIRAQGCAQGRAGTRPASEALSWGLKLEISPRSTYDDDDS